jgi:hypothetical protein
MHGSVMGREQHSTRERPEASRMTLSIVWALVRIERVTQGSDTLG